MNGYARDNPKTAAFLADLLFAYRKHGLALGHDDTQGAFEVRPLSNLEVGWLNDAFDCLPSDQAGATSGQSLHMLLPRSPVPNDDALRFASDVARLRGILNARGFDASDEHIAWAYAQWSEDYFAAGWLRLDDDDGALFEALMEYLAVAAPST